MILMTPLPGDIKEIINSYNQNRNKDEKLVRCGENELKSRIVIYYEHSNGYYFTSESGRTNNAIISELQDITNRLHITDITVGDCYA